MPINGASIRGWYESQGPVAFVRQFHEELGLPGSNGRKRFGTKPDGSVVLESKRSINPSQVSIKELAMAMIGPWDEDLDRGLDGDNIARANAATPVHQAAMEGGGDATSIVPSQFANISAFNAAAIGLLEARFLEAYASSEFIADRLVENIPTKLRSMKMIGISNIGDLANARKPGERHAMAPLTERFVTTPQTRNIGLGIRVTKEAVLFDRTFQLLKQAESVAHSMKLRKEYQILDVVLGVVNPYNYNGTSYWTYAGGGSALRESTTYPAGTLPTGFYVQDYGGGNYCNQVVNPMLTWQAMNIARFLWTQMVDPETGQPIDIGATDVLCMPGNELNFSSILSAENISRFTEMAAAQGGGAGGVFPAGMFNAKNPISGEYNLISPKNYPYAIRRVTDADGLNITPDSSALSSVASTAKDQAYGLWYVGNFKKAFHWNENIPLTLVRANPNEMEMGDMGLVLALFADEMGAAGVTEPRYVIQCFGGGSGGSVPAIPITNTGKADYANSWTPPSVSATAAGTS